MLRSLRLVVCAGTVAVLGSAALAQNGDLCTAANPVSEGTFPFDNTGYGTEFASDCATSGHDVWYLYTPSITGVATIDTCGSSFDTVLSVVLDCFVEIDCNDDACGLQSTIAGVQVYEGISINIRVAAYGSGVGGAGVLNINVTPPPPPAQWDELTNGGADAGDSLAAAQVPTGTNPLTDIGGAIDFLGDADLYLINICDLANFTATTYGLTDESLDTRLYLFDTSGNGITFNDDVPNGFPGDLTLLSRVSNLHVPAAGDYYLAVTFYDNAPTDAADTVIWNETPFNTERAPDGPASTSPLVTWNQGGFETGSYRVALTGACFHSSGPACDPDLNQDGNVDQDDVSYLINVVGGGENSTNIDPDFNQDGNVDQDDVGALINTVGGAGCP